MTPRACVIQPDMDGEGEDHNVRHGTKRKKIGKSFELALGVNGEKSFSSANIWRTDSLCGRSVLDIVLDFF